MGDGAINSSMETAQRHLGPFYETVYREVYGERIVFFFSYEYLIKLVRSSSFTKTKNGAKPLNAAMAFSFETSNKEEENSNPELFAGVRRVEETCSFALYQHQRKEPLMRRGKLSLVIVKHSTILMSFTVASL